MTALQRVQDALEADGVSVRDTVKNQDVKCPAHEDGTASLSIGQGDNGAVVHCHAGCSPDQVLSTIGMTFTDLFDEPTDPTPQIIAEYPYLDENGVELFQQVRYDPKDFRLRHRDGSKWDYNIRGIRRVLYRLPDVLDAVAEGHQVIVVEGEKDADRLHREGLVATTSPMGAGKWDKTETDVLRGAHVMVLPDNDESGRAHAEDIASDLDGKAASVRVLHLPGVAIGGDVSDWLNTGRGVDELKMLISETSIWVPEATDNITTATGAWTPTDLLALASNGLDIIEPDVLYRRDGRALLYSGKMNVIFGSPETGKTWIAIIAIAELVRTAVSTGGGVVAVFIDFEDDATSFLVRLQAAGIAPEDAARHTKYYPAAQSLKTVPDDLDGLTDAKLIVLDTTNSAMTLDGLDPLLNKDALLFINEVRRLRTGSSAAWLLLDHEPIAADNTRKNAIGAQSKLAAVDGVQYRAKAVKQPRPGHEGTISLHVTKDRAGGIRRYADKPDTSGIEHAATIYLNPLGGAESDRFQYVVAEPQGIEGDSQLRAAILCATSGAYLSMNAIREQLKAEGAGRRKKTMDAAVHRLVSEGHLMQSEKGHHPTYMAAEVFAQNSGHLLPGTSPEIRANTPHADARNSVTALRTASPDKLGATRAS